MHGRHLVFWESWQNHVVKCVEMKLCKVLDLKVKVKTDKSKFQPIMTVECEDEVLKCDNVRWNCHGRTPMHLHPGLHMHKLKYMHCMSQQSITLAVAVMLFDNRWWLGTSSQRRRSLNMLVFVTWISYQLRCCERAAAVNLLTWEWFRLSLFIVRRLSCHTVVWPHNVIKYLMCPITRYPLIDWHIGRTWEIRVSYERIVKHPTGHKLRDVMGSWNTSAIRMNYKTSRWS